MAAAPVPKIFAPASAAAAPAAVFVGSPVNRALDEISYIFSDVRVKTLSNQSKLYVALNYNGTDYSHGPNTKENPDVIKRLPIWQLMLAKNYSNAYDPSGNLIPGIDDNTIHKNFVDFIVNCGILHKLMDDSGIHIAGKDVYDLLMDNNNFNRLTEEAREFFSQNINAVETISRYDSAAVLGNMKTGNPRFNLKRVQPPASPNTRETIFGSCIPFLPNGAKVFTPGTPATLGTPATPDAVNPVSVIHLHKEYNTYQKPAAATSTMVGGDMKVLASAWGLDYSKFVKGLMKIYTSRPETKKHDLRDEFDGVYHDAASDQVYVVKNDKVYYRDENGVEHDVEADDNLLRGVVPSIAECILRGDSVGLTKCLNGTDELVDDKIIKEIKGMHPDTVRRVLQTFEVKIEGGKFQHYLQWRDSLATVLSKKYNNPAKGQQLANQILGKPKLCTYIARLIQYANNNNKVIVSHDTTLSDLPEREVKRNDRIAYFVNKVPANMQSTLGVNQLRTMVSNLNLIPPTFSNLFPGMGAGFGIPVPFQRGGQHGGGNDPVATQLMNTYKAILADMNTKGKDLVQEDKDRIEKVIQQIAKNNKEITEILSDLQAFSKLESTLSVVKLTDIEGARNIKTYKSSVGKLQDCLNRTASNQVSLLTALVNQVYTPMLGVLSGVTSPFIRPQ